MWLDLFFDDLLIHFPFAFSSCDTLVFDDCYNTFACFGTFEKHDLTLISLLFRYLFWHWTLMVVGIGLGFTLASGFVFSRDHFSNIYWNRLVTILFFNKKDSPKYKLVVLQFDTFPQGVLLESPWLDLTPF